MLGEQDDPFISMYLERNLASLMANMWTDPGLCLGQMLGGFWLCLLKVTCWKAEQELAQQQVDSGPLVFKICTCFSFHGPS